MTVFGPDISSFQHGLDLSRLNDASFVIAKATQGTFYTDANYEGWRIQAARLGKLFCWYHFLSGEDAALQAQHTLDHVGDKTLPGMLDIEPDGNYTPTLAEAQAYIDAAHAAGLNLRLAYLPRWVHAQWGSPSLSGLTQRGVALVASGYPGGSGTAAQIYPGDRAAGWADYGGMTPLLYQFTNQASDGGQNLDYNAFRGVLARLAVYLQAPVPTPGGSTVGTIPASIGTKWPEVADQFPANSTFDSDTALIWADGGARAAALYSAEARDAATSTGQAVDALSAKLDALAATVAAPPAIDVNALATLIDQHLTAGSTADVIAAAVMHRLSADTANG